ncbi:hypothetical protein BJ508DRAFT_308239 [Ascobolus immersus RN42]|uniref:Uncharacterized protein n=1 Tax=Ascobolus immersus RN42 TaxID=1160509 RepID=A0A3N4I0J0_ASCIM|nr:hypothetical protein BJ508DRAFT_308239 [Ascobolus immersus RN42]
MPRFSKTQPSSHQSHGQTSTKARKCLCRRISSYSTATLPTTTSPAATSETQSTSKEAGLSWDLIAYHRPMILRNLGLLDDEVGREVLMDLSLEDQHMDYVSTSNFIPFYIVAGAAFQYREQNPHYLSLFTSAMGCDPAYPMQARYVLSRTPYGIHYPPPGSIPTREAREEEKRSFKDRLQGAVHSIIKKTFNPNARSRRKPQVVDQEQLRRSYVTGLWDLRERLEAMPIEEIDWLQGDPSDED